MDIENLSEIRTKVTNRLLDFRSADSHWRGKLSSSALATATAVAALSLTDLDRHKKIIDAGLNWLCENINDDGGWGDTPTSQSNISTTILCWAAFAMTEDNKHAQIVEKAQSWLNKSAGGITPGMLSDAIYRRYGGDRTFAVPILTMCALAGKLGDDPWGTIKPLPFELAVFPHRLYKWLKLSVVSYALAALIAIGQVHYHFHKPSNIFTRIMRAISRKRTLAKLIKIQPENGGFLEAITLTSFVVMSLAAAGNKDHKVATKGTEFILSAVRDDGSWPIDTDLATWLTTLSVNALSLSPDYRNFLPPENRKQILHWLSSQQYQELHLYVHADPGGWAWTDKPGGVPDADDTAGALIALRNLDLIDDSVIDSTSRGLNWLMNIQNSDGGMPTFCRGWQDMPFDRSAPDLTAHAIAAMSVWADKVDSRLASRMRNTIRRAIDFLTRAQRANGTWIPLWFGNEKADYQQNPTYGTARVLLGLMQMPDSMIASSVPILIKAANFLVSIQNDDGGWGGAESITSSIEETALATDALAVMLSSDVLRSKNDFRYKEIDQAVTTGASWLVKRFSGAEEIKPAPIGLYFASLWYYEELYPWIFTASALQRVENLFG